QTSLRLLSVAALLSSVVVGQATRAPATEPPAAIQLAQADQSAPPRELQPRYEPAPPETPSWYNSSYIFGMTRSVAESTMVPGAKAPLFLLTVPLDLVLLPFEAIGGLFG